MSGRHEEDDKWYPITGIPHFNLLDLDEIPEVIPSNLRNSVTVEVDPGGAESTFGTPSKSDQEYRPMRFSGCAVDHVGRGFPW